MELGARPGCNSTGCTHEYLVRVDHNGGPMCLDLSNGTAGYPLPPENGPAGTPAAVLDGNWVSMCAPTPEQQEAQRQWQRNAPCRGAIGFTDESIRQIQKLVPGSRPGQATGNNPYQPALDAASKLRKDVCNAPDLQSSEAIFEQGKKDSFRLFNQGQARAAMGVN
jgi:hypothetical protein